MPEAESPEAAAPLVVDQAAVTTAVAGLETLPVQGGSTPVLNTQRDFFLGCERHENCPGCCNRAWLPRTLGTTATVLHPASSLSGQLPLGLGAGHEI